jgi:arylsulfatase
MFSAAVSASWPDGGITPFQGEKGTTWEGGHRVPLVVRWPGVLKPGTVINDMIAHNDWMPTLVAAAGEPEVKTKLLQGYQANGKNFKVHFDGYNFLPFFKGDAKKAPREEYFYFDQGGNLNAARWNDWKVHFATLEGNIAQGTRVVPGWPTIVNLRADPYEKAPHEAALGYLRWYGDNLWLFVPVQQKIKDFFKDFAEYPHQVGSSLNAAGVNYQTLRAAEALKRLNQLENLAPPRN